MVKQIGGLTAWQKRKSQKEMTKNEKIERQAGRGAGKPNNALKTDIWADCDTGQKSQNILKQHKYTLSDCNRTRTYNHFVHKPTLNDLAKLASLAVWVFDSLSKLPSLTVWLFGLYGLIIECQFTN